MKRRRESLVSAVESDAFLSSAAVSAASRHVHPATVNPALLFLAHPESLATHPTPSSQHPWSASHIPDESALNGRYRADSSVTSPTSPLHSPTTFYDATPPQPSRLRGKAAFIASGKKRPFKEACLKIIDQLCKKDEYMFFLHPVDPIQVPGYLQVIQHPMDFQTMREKVYRHAYTSLDEFKVISLSLLVLSYLGFNVFFFCRKISSLL